MTTRRNAIAAVLAAPFVIRPFMGSGLAADAPGWNGKDPFSLGVAAGSPAADGFVLWTRLAPDPMAADDAAPGGMTGPARLVKYEIAEDEIFRRIVRRGFAAAEPQFGYSVHATVEGLKPGRDYWYRFTSGDAVSATGRARTLPAPRAAVDRLRFGFVSCSNYEVGYFSAYRHLAAEQPDLVLFLGDYIYEGADKISTDLVRHHSDGVAADTLARYRRRYSQYRRDPDLQALHAAATGLHTWDDHEVSNDYADQWSEYFADPAAFLQRRAAAYQAFYEFMPVRRRPQGPDMRVYDATSYGDLAQFFVLDGRQYRSREACYAKPDKGHGHQETPASCPELVDPARTFLGRAQEQWLYDGLSRSRRRWNILAQDQLIAQLLERTDTGQMASWTDDWNGYPAARARLIAHIADSKVTNPVTIGGDIHSYWVNDLKRDFNDPNAPAVATEFVGTSITSRGIDYAATAGYLPDNPHIKFFESRLRGYVSMELRPKMLTARLQTVSDVRDPDAGLSTLRTFVVEDGRPGAVPV